MKQIKFITSLLFLTIGLISVNAIADVDAKNKNTFDSIIKHLKTNKIEITEAASEIKTDANGNPALKITTKDFLPISVILFATKEDAQKEEANMAQKLKDHPEMAGMLNFSRNENLIILAVVVMPNQNSEAKAVLNAFSTYKNHPL